MNKSKLDLTVQKDNIKIDGQYGIWHIIDKTKDGRYFLLEHDTYGDEAACLIVTPTGRVKLDDVHNGLAELDY